MAAAAAGVVQQCDEDQFVLPQSRFGCFGRSLSRVSSGRRLEYCRTVAVSEGEEVRRAAQDRSARAKLRWKAVAREIMARRRGAMRRKQQQPPAAAAAAFTYDSRSYALNFDQGAEMCA